MRVGLTIRRFGPAGKGPGATTRATGDVMAKNTGDGYRRGAVTGRTQFERPDGHYQKRDERTGEFMEVKQSPGRFKGVAREPDGRDTSKA
jgi:hypothetical protein